MSIPKHTQPLVVCLPHEPTSHALTAFMTRPSPPVNLAVLWPPHCDIQGPTLDELVEEAGQRLQQRNQESLERFLIDLQVGFSQG